MKVEVRITKSFKKAVKPLLKKYASLLGELAELETELLKIREREHLLETTLIKSG